MSKSSQQICEELHKKIIEHRGSQRSVVPPYIHEPGLNTTDNLTRYYTKLFRWDVEHEATVSLGKLLVNTYGIDLDKLQEQIRSVDAKRARELLGLGNKPRRMS